MTTKKSQRIRANSKMFAAEVWTEMLRAFERGEPVTLWCLEPKDADPNKPDFIFEIRVTAFGDARVRSAKALKAAIAQVRSQQ